MTVEEGKTWPREYSDKIIIGNKNSNVGIATLWSVKEEVAELLDSSDYCVIANYYDVYNGFEPMLRNCLANPLIRYIIVVGHDRSGSKEVLTNFFNFGVENGFICNTQVPIPEEIPVQDILSFKENVELIDLTTQVKDPTVISDYAEILGKTIRNLEKKGEYALPRIYPKIVREISTLPSDNVGFYVKGTSVGNAWLQILFNICKYGVKTFTVNEESGEIRECINCVTVIRNEDPDDPKIEEFFKIDKERLFQYYDSICSAKLPPATAYTYGYKLRGEKIDQIEQIIAVIKKNKTSKRCFATTWNPENIGAENPPCLTSIQVNVQNNVLFITAYFRSHDIFKAFILNSFGILKLQKIISEATEIPVGPLTIISQSGHIYKQDIKEANEIIKKFYQIEHTFDDPRGYYVIQVDNGVIKAVHYTPTGKKLFEYEGTTSSEIMTKINDGIGPTDKYHIAYLSKELTKA